MPHNELTELYLKEAAGRLAPGDLPAAAAQGLDLAATSFRGRCLTRPVFLTRAELTQLTSDLENVYGALTALPGRLFSGDLGAFARAVGLTGAQVGAVAMARGTPPTRMVRADLYREAAGFRLMELNVGSTVGGGDNAMVNRAMLANADLAGFVRAHALTYTDTLAEIANTIMAETGVAARDGSLVAAVDWPPAAPRFNAVLQTSADELAGLGLDFVPCHLRDLSRHDGRVWLGDRPVDVIYRIFMVEDLLDPDGPGLITWVLEAAERGEVRIFTPMHSHLYSAKGALALLSDEAHRHLYTPAELASLDRLLPWTRLLRPGPVTVDGERVDLLRYATTHREHLILKPTARHGGSGIVPGWLTDTAAWDGQLRALMGEPFVVQRRVQPEPELFPGEGGLEPWVLTWGAYLGARGYAGMWVRGTADRDTGGVNMATGAYATCCFTEAPTAGDG